MAGLLLCALVVAGLVVATHRPQHAVLPGQPGHGARARSGTDLATDRRADAAAALLARLTATLEHGPRRALAQLAAGPAAGRELTTMWRNVRALRLTDLSMRYVEDGTDDLSAGQRRSLGTRRWVGRVELGWRLGGVDAHPATRELPVTFSDRGSAARFVTVRRGYGDPTPLWMLQRLTAERTERSLVAGADADTVDRFSALADQAVVDVRRVLPAWRGRLVVEVPSSQRQLSRVMGAGAGAYSEIAAVTTTVDGSLSPRSPVHIFVNPAVFDPLGPRGSQIVMSHEATHVATHAALSSMPSWLLEGFADYVALDHAGLPVAVSASQVLRQVRRSGPPTHLPGKAEFDAHNATLGASYESAWLACRLLADEYGEARLVSFYRTADRTSVAAAFRSLGTDQRHFTARWRADLRRLAG